MSKKLRPFLIRAGFLMVVGAIPYSTAYAQNTCAPLFSSASEIRHTRIQELATVLTPLHERLLKRANEGFLTALELPLLPQERTLFLEAPAEILQKISSQIETLQSPAKDALAERLHELKKQNSLLHDSALTIEQAFAHADQVAYFSSFFVLAKESPHVPYEKLREPNVFQSWKSERQLLATITGSRKIIPLPTTMSLTVRDLNRSLVTQVAFIGLTTGRVLADNVNRTPWAFFGHDITHSAQQMTFLTPQIWQKVLDEVSTWSPHEQAAAHVLIFQMTHEDKGYKGEFKAAAYVNENFNAFEKRLQNEFYYGEKKLKDVTNLQALMTDVAFRLDQSINISK